MRQNKRKGFKVNIDGTPLYFSSKQEAYTSITAIAKGYKTNSIENTRCNYAIAMLIYGKRNIDCLSEDTAYKIEAIHYDK